MPKKKFNIFKILSLSNEEYHNKLLFWLLSPEGDHNLGNMFVRLFFERIGISNFNRLKIENISAEFQIGPFYLEEKKRPDIIIETNLHYLIIENKVNYYSMDDDQLKEEYEFGIFEATKKKKELKLIFLTPSDEIPKYIIRTINKNEGILHLTWKNIGGLIEHLLNKRNVKDELYFLLSQYKEYIDKIISVKIGIKKTKENTANVLLEKILEGNKTNASILSFLVMHQDNFFSIHQLSKILEAPYGTIWNTVKDLASVGIVSFQKRGKSLQIEINKHHYIFNDLQELITKSLSLSK